MFCETSLWSMGCDKNLQTNRDPICLVEISSGRSVSVEDMSGEGWISEYQTPSKQHHRIISKPHTKAISRIFHSAKSWTFLQFKTSTPAWRDKWPCCVKKTFKKDLHIEHVNLSYIMLFYLVVHQIKHELYLLRRN